MVPMTTLAEQILVIESELSQLETKRKLLLQKLYDLKIAQNAGEQKSKYSTLEKLNIFNDLFAGRRDVYAQGFESRKYMKMGYYPACANADNMTLCKRGIIRCSKCPHRKYALFDFQVIKNHLRVKIRKEGVLLRVCIR